MALVVTQLCGGTVGMAPPSCFHLNLQSLSWPEDIVWRLLVVWSLTWKLAMELTIASCN